MPKIGDPIVTKTLTEKLAENYYLANGQGSSAGDLPSERRKDPVPKRVVLTPQSRTVEDLPELARAEDLFGAIRKDLNVVGIVGEEDNAMLIFLIYVSRLLANPGAVVTRGKSGTGKSTLLKRVAALFPPEVKIEAMTMTQASWFNTTEDYFKHKIFLSGERRHSLDDQARDAGALLRQLLSEKRVNRGVSIYDQQTKSWSTQMIDREGPIAYAESTTSGSVFEEDLNRMLQLYVDDSEAQTRRVMEAVAGKYDPDKPVVDIEAVIKRHHEFQRYLQSLPICQVGIPYAQVLVSRMPAGKAEARRVIQQVCTVIEVIVLLQQHDREERNGHRLATIADYARARKLLLSPLHAALGIGTDYKNALRLRIAKLGPAFSTPQVKAALNCPNDMGPSRLLNSLVEAGLLVRLTEQKGRSPAIYKWAVKDGANLDTLVLPTVGEIQQAAAVT